MESYTNINQTDGQVQNRTVYVDMDGVLADFDGYFNQITGLATNNIEDSELWSRIDAHGKSRFFSELPWMPGGKDLWQFVIDNFLSVKILSALGRSDVVDGQTSAGKKAWLRKNIPTLRESDIILVPNKHKKRHYSRPGDIIIDDTDVVIAEWVKKGGTGILHKTAQYTIGKLKQFVYEDIKT